jgi:4-amino-4-deoxy-L-arabinose transferase-like glycosyltransferase
MARVLGRPTPRAQGSPGVARLDRSLGFRWWLAALVLAVTLNAAVFARVNSDRIVFGTDSPEYDLLARQLNLDRGFTLQAEAPFVPTLWREPGYPLLVASVYHLTDNNIEVVVGLQCLLLGLAAGVTALIGARLFGPLSGLLGGALFGLSSESAHYAHWLLTEVPFTLLLLVSVALAMQVRQARHADLVLVGVGFGLAALVRAIALGALGPVALALSLSGPRRGWPLRLALVLSGAALVLAPWVARNWVALGHPALTSRFGVNLLRRAPRAAEPPAAYADFVKASVWIMANPLSQVVYPMSRLQWGPESDENLIWDFHVNDMVRYLRRYEPICLPTPDPDACYTDIGLAFVRAYPVGYLATTAFELVKIQFAPLPGPQALVHNATVWLGLLSGLVLLVRRRLGRAHLPVVAAVVGYVGAAVLVDTQVRYLLPVLPMYAMFAAVPMSAVLTRRAPRWSLATHAFGGRAASCLPRPPGPPADGH